MKLHPQLPDSRSMNGFSLIELMVALAIGLIIATAAFSAYLGASNASRVSDAQVRMNEDAQAALSILSQQLRMAGNNPNEANRTDATRRNLVYGPNASATPYPSSFSLRGCGSNKSGVKSRFSNLETAVNMDGLKCEADANTISDSIAVSYEADAYNTVPTPLKLPTDCLGAALVNAGASADPFYVASNVFYIGGSSGRPSLYCKGNGLASVAQSLVENIEDMQFAYGTAKSSTSAEDMGVAVVAGYLTADAVLTEISMAGLPNDAARWAKVITVRICIVVRSDLPVAVDSTSARYLKCDGSLELAPPDLHLRRIYATTVVLRNRRFAS